MLLEEEGRGKESTVVGEGERASAREGKSGVNGSRPGEGLSELQAVSMVKEKQQVKEVDALKQSKS